MTRTGAVGVEDGRPATVLTASRAAGASDNLVGRPRGSLAREERGFSLPGRDVVALSGIALLAFLAWEAMIRFSAPRGFPGAVWNGMADAACGAASLVVLASLAARIFRSRSVAWASAVVGAAGYLLRTHPESSASEPLILGLSVFGFLLLVTVDRPSSGCGVGAGAVLGSAILFQPVASILTPLLLAPLFDRRFPPAIRRVLAGSAAFGLAAVLAAGYIARGIRDGLWSPEGFLPGSGAGVAFPAFSPGLPSARILWLCLLFAFGVVGWLRAQRRGARVVALAALGLALAVLSAPAAAGKTRASIVYPLLALYGAAGIIRTVRPA
jgi:hypothetical protein